MESLKRNMRLAPSKHTIHIIYSFCVLSLRRRVLSRDKSLDVFEFLPLNSHNLAIRSHSAPSFKDSRSEMKSSSAFLKIKKKDQ